MLIITCDGRDCPSVTEPKYTGGSAWRIRAKPEMDGDVWHFCSDKCEGNFLITLATENEQDNGKQIPLS